MFLLGLVGAESGNKFVEFMTTEISFGTAITVSYWHIIVVAVVLLAVIIALSVVANRLAKKGKRQYEKTEEVIDVTSEEISATETKEEVEPQDVVIQEEEKVEQTAEPIAELTVEEKEEEKVEKVEVIVEEKSEEKADKEEVVATTVKKTAPKSTSQKTEVKKQTAKVKPTIVFNKVEEKVESKVAGKIEICNSDLGGYNYLLLANNGQLLYESKSYKSVESCREAIANFIVAVEAGRFTVRADKFKNFKFILKSPTSNTLLYVGESFSQESSCRHNIESVKRFAPISPIVDITSADFVAKFVKYEISEECIKSVEENTGAVGKWEIAKVDENAKNSPFVYLLYANNGQLLYESRDYKTYASCLSGLNTFINTVKNGFFVIDPDKSGRYKFVLRNQSANSPMEYYGQNYDTQRACASSIESVYHFALRSPVPEK